MNTKGLLSAVAISASAMALWGCAGTPPKLTGSAPFDCKKNSCDVPVGYYFLGDIGIPEVIEVNAPDENAEVTVTWTLSSIWGVTFADKGIVVDGPFKCDPVGSSRLQYQCKGKGLKRSTDYKYTVTLAGSLRPWPLDPYIRN